MARCPECTEKLTLPANLERWSRIYCGSCKAELQVLSLRPLELEAVYAFEEGDELIEDLEELEDSDDLEDLDDLEWDDDDDDHDDDDDDDDDDEW